MTQPEEPAAGVDPPPPDGPAPVAPLHPLATLVWIVQALAFALLSAAWMLGPRRFLDAAPTDALDRFAAGAVRARAPFALAFALISAYAAMREDAAARRAYARGFALTFALWALVDARRLSWERPRALLLDAAILAAPLAANAVFALALRVPVAPWRRLSGSSSTLPPQLWLWWALQGAVLLVVGGALLLAPQAVAAWTTRLSPPELPAAAEHLRLLGAMTTGIGVFSWSAMRVEQEWLWRVYGSSAALFLLSCLFALLVAWEGDLYRPWAGVALAALGAALALGNVAWQGPRRPWFPEDDGRGPDGWVLMDLLLGPWFAALTLRSGRRASHAAGVAARGEFTFAPSADVPRHDFFRPRPPRPAVVRFSNATARDDAALDVRGCALRLAGPGRESPFDLALNTGVVSPAAELVAFAGHTLAERLRPLGALVARRSWRAREVALVGLRRAPPCYSALRYHTQTVRLWIDADDVRHLVRYRLVPDDPDAPEAGLPDERDHERAWDRARRPDEARPADYLARALRRALEGDRALRLRLQAQFHTPREGDGVEWFNAAAEWPEDEHPWRDLGVVRLDAPLSDAECEGLEFNAGRHPASLGVPRSPGARDYRSLADSERRVVRRLAALRRWRGGALGRAPQGRP